MSAGTRGPRRQLSMLGTRTEAATRRVGGSILGASASRLGRAAIAGVLSPAAERALNRVGYRRAAVAAVCFFTVVAVAIYSIGALVAAVLAPVAMPLTIATELVGSVKAVFGEDGSNGSVPDEGEQVISCRPQNRTGSTSSTQRSNDPGGSRGRYEAAQVDTRAARAPQTLNSDGSLPQGVAKGLVTPIPPETSGLTANVWFLFHLSGMGEKGTWSEFMAQYRSAGLTGTSDAPRAALRQVQELNRDSVDIEPYRTVAASLTLLGIQIERFTSPGDEFQSALGQVILMGCLPRSEMPSTRAPAPPPRGNSAAAATSATASGHDDTPH